MGQTIGRICCCRLQSDSISNHWSTRNTVNTKDCYDHQPVVGSTPVISGDLSIGQLIAFNMLAGQIVAPVIRLAQIWQDFQQVGISVTRLGDVLNSPTESYHGKLALPEINGDITFRNIRFRYKPDSPVILDNINLSIKQGRLLVLSDVLVQEKHIN